MGVTMARPVLKKAKPSKTEGLALSDRAMLAHVKLSYWSAGKQDQQLAEEVTINHNASSDSGSFRKYLIPRRHLAELHRVISAVRKVHKGLTLPWNDDGTRILTATGFQQYQEKMRRLELEFETRAKKFVDNFPQIIKEARSHLGSMFDSSDYPDVKRLAKRFKFEMVIEPLPTSKDFRVKLSDEAAKEIAADIDRRTNERIEEAMGDVFKRVHTAVSHLGEKLKNYEPIAEKRAAEKESGKKDSKLSRGKENQTKAVIQSTTVENLRDLIDTLPLLNLTDNPKLDELIEQLRDDFYEHNVDDYRTNRSLRKDTAKKADAILEQVAAYLPDE